MKDSNFYNKESTQYAKKRYPKRAASYTQFFFKRRLALTILFVRKLLASSAPKTLLEVGCADGVVLRAIGSAFPTHLSDLRGIDIAEDMVREAQRQNTDSRAQYALRSEYHAQPMDIVVEVGVVNYADFTEELAFAARNLTDSGWYILSVAGTGSLLNRLKPEQGFNDFRPYAEYERLIGAYFTTRAVRGCGFFVPYLWRVPALARVLQPVIEALAGRLAPGLCHEKVYLLQKK